MAGERTLKVTILGDADKLRRTFDQAGREADGFGHKLAGAAKVAGVAIAGLGAGGLVIAKNAVGAASDLAETQSKVKVIFGNSSKDIELFAKNAARDFGQTKTQAMNAAATFATFGKAAGLQNKDLTEFSTKMTGLASDLASFHNTKPEEAVQALGAALRGESEPLRRYGVMLDDATLKAAAMELGIYDGTGALTAQQKTLATQKVIMDQTKDAAGDFERTSGGLANQQRILTANLGDVSAKIGTALLPAMTGITTVASEIVTAFSEGGWSGAMSKVAEIWGELWPKIKAKLGEFISALGEWIVAEGPGILRKLGEWTGAFLGWVAGARNEVVEKLGELIGALLGWIGDNREAILDKLGEWTGKFLEWAGSVVLPLLAKLGELLVKVFQWVSDNRQAIFDKLGEWTGKFIDWAADMLGKLLGFLVEKVIPAVLKWIVDNGPTILLELAKWTASFIAWAVEMNLKLLGKLAEAAVALLKWIGDQALEIAKKLPGWTAEFVAWVVGLAPAMVEGMAKVMDWIGDQAGNLPGKLLGWTTAFSKWLGDLAGNMSSALVDFAHSIASMIWDWIKDKLPGGTSKGIGGNSQGVSQSGAKVKFEDGQWVYDGGPKGGQPVAPNDLSAQQKAMQSGGGSTPGAVQSFAQQFAAGKSIQQIALETGQSVAAVTAAIVGDIPGAVLGGSLDDTDHSNDGDLSPSGPGETNLTANAVKMRRQITSNFKGYSSIGGYAYRTTAAGTPSDHATGKALDIMLPGLSNPLGDKIAGWAAGQSETKYVIWDNQIWSRSKPTWRDYATSGAVGRANQGSPTGRHEDHVHISVLGNGGIVVNLYVAGSVIRERDLVTTVRDGLLDLQRQGVSLGFN